LRQEEVTDKRAWYISRECIGYQRSISGTIEMVNKANRTVKNAADSSQNKD
jgi:hypothetical protein